MNKLTDTERFTLRELTTLLLIVAATTLGFVGAAEVGTRILFPEQLVDSCSGGVGLVGHRANCSFKLKAAEGDWIDFHFNECGYRGPSCSPTPTRVPRLVVLGSSTSFGYLVSYGDTWSVKVAGALSKLCTSSIDVQNIGGEGAWGDLNVTVERAQEIRALHPTVVALVITPFDLFNMQPEGSEPALIVKSAPTHESAPKRSVLERLRAFLKESRAAEVAQHYIFADPKIYVSSYLILGDKADYLRSPLSPRWRERLTQLDHAVHSIASEAALASAPLYLVIAPTEAQAELLEEASQSRAGLDPNLFTREVASIAKRNHATLVDGITPFSSIKDAQNYFYRSEGHLNSLGHEILAKAMIDSLKMSNEPQQLCGGKR